MAILSSSETMEKFKIGSTTTVMNLFKAHGSPAFKIGKDWRVDEVKFEQFLLKQSEKFKG